jgi:hypothetical protein
MTDFATLIADLATFSTSVFVAEEPEQWLLASRDHIRESIQGSDHLTEREKAECTTNVVRDAMIFKVKCRT